MCIEQYCNVQLGWVRKSIFFYYAKYEILYVIKVYFAKFRTKNFATFRGISLENFAKFRKMHVAKRQK
jgi:hypothetical protein